MHSAFFFSAIISESMFILRRHNMPFIITKLLEWFVFLEMMHGEHNVYYPKRYFP
jgi:hypothetical protein